MNMEREPSSYSRLLVVLGLVSLLVLDRLADLPDGAFVAGGAVVLGAAAAVHLHGGETRAGAGWLVFSAAVVVAAFLDVTANVASLTAFAVLLLVGLLLQLSQRLEGLGVLRER